MYLLKKTAVIITRSHFMRRPITLLLLIFCVSAFSVTPEDLLKIKPVYNNKYIPHGLGDSTIEIPVRFDEAQLLFVDRIKTLNARSIKRVTLYYTAYKLSQSFSQPELNGARFKNLQAAFPSLFESSFIEWRVVGQTAPANAEEAKKLFHGFVFEFFPLPTKESVKLEMRAMETILASKELGEDSVYYTDAVRTRIKKAWTGHYLPNSKWRRNRGVLCSKKGIWNRSKEMLPQINETGYKVAHHKFKASPKALDFVFKSTSDSTIFAILNRNKDWNNMVFVVDVTGSMSPYTSQLFVWYKLNSTKRHVKSFTFFNDGDNKSDIWKRAGKTGGVYSTAAKEPDDVMKESQVAMMRGGGGDAPENNVEATLEAIEKNPDAKEVFMIADNYANMRDFSLISNITKPVHVLLCGTSYGAYNTQYLDLARKTGGSIHTLDEDIVDLLKLSEGETIKLGKQMYKIKKGKFELVYTL
jgi:hypothetical protein